MTKNKTHNSSREDTTNMSTKEVKEVKEIKLKYLSEKGNGYDTNHFFEVLYITPLQELIESGKLWKFLFGNTIISSIWKLML